MGRNILLGQEDIAILDTVLADFVRRFTLQNSLEGLERLLQGWDTFTYEVERGYTWTIFDYTNELGARSLLGRVEGALSNGGKQEIDRFLTPSDNRFQEASLLLQDPLRKLSDQAPAWWYYRIPRILVGELKDDLINEGVI